MSRLVLIFHVCRVTLSVVELDHTTVASRCLDSDGSLIVQGKVLQIRPSAFFLWLLRIHPENSAVTSNFSLETCNDRILLTPLVCPKSVRLADHLAGLESLCMPVIAVQSALQVLVLLLLQEVVVVSSLFKEAAFNPKTVVADSFSHVSYSIFVHGNEVGVLALFVLVGFDERVLLQ